MSAPRRRETTGGGRASLLRQAFASQGRPDLTRGIRASVVVGLPLVVAVAAGSSSTGLLISLGALQVVVVDGPFPYRSRAIVVATTALACALGIVVGTLAGNVAWLAVVLTGVWCGLTPLTGAFGPRYEPVGFVSAIMLLFGLASPGAVGVALSHGGAVLLGGLWAAAAALAAWHWQRDRPPTQGAVVALRACAAMVHLLSEETKACAEQGRGALSADSQAWSGAATSMVHALDAAGDAVVATYGAGRSDLRLVRLTHACERISMLATAVREDLASVGGAERGFRPSPELLEAQGCLLSVLSQALTTTADTLERSLHHAVEQGWNTPQLRRVALEADQAVARLEAVRSAARAQAAEQPGSAADLDSLAITTDRLVGGIHLAMAAAADRPAPQEAPRATSSAAKRLAEALGPHLSWSSPRARVGARLAITTAVAQAVVVSAAIDHGIWLIFALLTVLKSDQVATWTRAVQRTLGTVLGALIAAVLLTWVTNDLALSLVVTVLAGLCLSVSSVNYSYFIVLLTPLALMLVDVLVPSTWHDAILRLALTAVGALGAVAADSLLWPQHERDSFLARLSDTIASVGRYVDAVLSQFQSSAADPRTLEARHQAEEDHLLARDSLGRLELGSRAERLQAEAGAPALLAAAELFRTARAGNEFLAGATDGDEAGGPLPVLGPYRQRAQAAFATMVAQLGAGGGKPGSPQTPGGPADLLAVPPELLAPTGGARQHAVVRMLGRVDQELGRLSTDLANLSRPRAEDPSGARRDGPVASGNE